MNWQNLKNADWQHVANFCVQLFWQNSAWALLLLVFAPMSLMFLLEPISPLFSQIVVGILLIGLAGFGLMGMFGMLLSLWYMLRLKYRYRKSTPIKILITCALMMELYALGVAHIKKKILFDHSIHFIQTSQSIFEQLNANSQSIQAADAQMKQLIEKYNSSNNTLKVTRIISHSAQIYSTTSDREGLGHPVIQFQRRTQPDGRLFWHCQVVRAGQIDPTKLTWCTHGSLYRTNDGK